MNYASNMKDWDDPQHLGFEQQHNTGNGVTTNATVRFYIGENTVEIMAGSTVHYGGGVQQSSDASVVLSAAQRQRLGHALLGDVAVPIVSDSYLRQPWPRVVTPEDAGKPLNVSSHTDSLAAGARRTANFIMAQGGDKDALQPDLGNRRFATIETAGKLTNEQIDDMVSDIFHGSYQDYPLEYDRAIARRVEDAIGKRAEQLRELLDARPPAGSSLEQWENWSRVAGKLIKELYE